MLLTVMLAIALAGQGLAKETIPGSTNVTRVDATVACAGATSPEAFSEIKKLGFASIVNLRREQEPGADIPAAKAAAQASGLKYIHIPVDGAKPDPAAAEAFVAAVTDKANQPVFIHCASANRVGAMWFIKRVLVDGWDTDRAMDEATKIGLTNETLKKFAADYVAARRK